MRLHVQMQPLQPLLASHPGNLLVHAISHQHLKVSTQGSHAWWPLQEERALLAECQGSCLQSALDSRGLDEAWL